MTGTDVNPYASPVDVAMPAVDPRKQALAKLRGPSSGLLILSSAWILIGLLAIALGLLSLLDDSAGPLFDAFGFGQLIAVLASNLFIAFGTFCMRQGRRYRIAFATAVLASIPVLSPFVWLGIPLGIWTLVVLRRPEVRAAFDADAFG
jgi:hypothetical protein